MYAGLAHRWVADVYFTHVVTAFAHEREVMDIWFSLGFGLENVDVLRKVGPVEGTTAGVEIRRAGPEDLERLPVPALPPAHSRRQGPQPVQEPTGPLG